MGFMSRGYRFIRFRHTRHTSHVASHSVLVQMARNRKANADTSSSSESPQNLEISEEEQWRLVNETGILKRAIPPSSAVVEVKEQEDTPLAEEIFNSVTLIIPFSFLLLMFEMCVCSTHEEAELVDLRMCLA